MERMSQSAQSQHLWHAPVAERPLNATVVIPGSKSLSNRYLILAALGTHPVTLIGLLRSRDTELMMGALEPFGVRFDIDENEPTTVRVIPPQNGRFSGNTQVYCGLAGTVMRFVPGLTLFADGPVRFDGDQQAYARPMKPLLDGLEQLGARVDYHGDVGHLPFTITPPDAIAGDADTPSTVAIDSSGSSQFISGLLLIGARVPGGLQIVHTGKTLPSLPHIRMTVEDLRTADVSVTAEEQQRRWTVQPGEVQLPDTITVEPDLSNAAPFLGAAMIAGGSVSVPYWPRRSTQPGALLPGILQAMGAQVIWNGLLWQGNGPVEPNQPTDSAATDGTVPSAGSESVSDPTVPPITESGTLTITSDGTIRGLGRYDMSAAGEIAPSIAALAALADTPTQLVGIAHLRGHETNRLAALVTEIRRIGDDANELADGIEITPVSRKRLHGAVMETYADHRMATFAAMIGLAVPGTDVVDVETTRKTIPDFVGLWTAMLEQ